MVKRNKVKGKHAAHAKSLNSKKNKANKDLKSADALFSDESADETQESTFDIDLPKITTHAARGIDIPEIGDGTVVLGDVQRTEPVNSLSNLDTEANLAPIEADEFAQSPFWAPMEPEKVRKPLNKKKLGIAVGVIAGVLLLIYIIGAIVFSGRFYPNTTIGGKDISMMNMDEAAAVVDKIGSGYSVKVEGQGLDFGITSQEMGIDIDSKKVVADAHSSIPSWRWPIYVVKHNDVTKSLAAEYNANGLKDIVEAQVEELNADGTDPTNANVAYNSDIKKFEVTPEELGTKLDSERVLEVVDKAVIEMAPKADITKDELVQPTVFKDDERLAKGAEEANGFIGAKLKLKMGEYDAGTIDADKISEWVKFDDDYKASFDDDAMNESLQELGDSLDTIGNSRTYTRPDGKEVTVEGGIYGWEIDSEALASTLSEAVKNGTQGDIEVPVIAAGVYYDAENGIDWADYIDVDLSEQHARFISGSGEVLWESDVITGRPDGKHDTPTGVWTLFGMQSPATLKGEIQVATGQPEYETKVKYWMPFTYSGCGLHDATWQPAFGGNLYAQGLGSHGCVNLPYSAAESLYSQAWVGLPVIVHW